MGPKHLASVLKIINYIICFVIALNYYNKQNTLICFYLLSLYPGNDSIYLKKRERELLKFNLQFYNNFL